MFQNIFNLKIQIFTKIAIKIINLKNSKHMSSSVEQMVKAMAEGMPEMKDGEMPQLDPEEMSRRVDGEMKRMEEEHVRKTGRYMPSPTDVEDFLSKVNKVHDQVKDIIDGKTDLEEFDKEEH